MPGSGLVLVAELERGLDCHVESGIHHRAGEHDSLGDLHSFYNNAIDLTMLLMYSFNISTIVLAASRTLSLHSPLMK